MRNIGFSISIVLGLFLFSSSLFSQVTIEGEYRPRVLVDDGYKTIKTTDLPTLVSVSQRTRLNLAYTLPRLKAYFSIQDIHVWGDDNLYSSSGMLGNSNSLSMHQAWVAFLPNPKFEIKLGRQLFSYDDQRLLSERNWNDYQVSYDAVLFKLGNERNKIDLAFSWNSQSTTNPYFSCNKLKTLNFARVEQKSGNFTLSAIALVTGKTLSDTTTAMALMGTYGANCVYKTKQLQLRATAYYQNNLNQKSGQVEAFCLSFNAKHQLLSSKASLAIGYDWLSGHDDAHSDAAYLAKRHTFTVFYGNRHGVLGYMDYYNTIPDKGIKDLMLLLEYKPKEKLAFQADLHYFSLATGGYDWISRTELTNLNMGTELDLTLKWKIMKEAQLQMGYSVYWKTENLEKWKGVYGKESKFPQFAYLMLTVKPSWTNKSDQGKNIPANE
jgi:hypothetical protein